jgi:hypothetical protein
MAGAYQRTGVTDKQTVMRIDTNSELSRAARIQAPTPPRKTPTEPNKVDLAKANALDAALKATPDTRAEQVARAKELIRDPGYPSGKVVDQVAAVLARRIRSKE